MLRKCILFLIFVFILFFPVGVGAQSIEDKISDLQGQINALNNDIKNKEANYSGLNTKLDQIRSQLVAIEDEIDQKAKEVTQGEKVLSYQTGLLNERARSYYKNLSKSGLSLMDFIVSGNLSVSLENFFYQKSVVDEDRNTIIKIVLYIKDLQDKKAALQAENLSLSSLKEEITKEANLLASDITSMKSKVAELSRQQQDLIVQRQASLNIPKSAGSGAPACVDDRDKDPGFSPRVAFFTYGVPNRVGLSQYGAYGRSKANQNYDQILRAYYNFDNYQTVDVNTNIRVDDVGWNGGLEDYMKRIYEVPNSWGDSGGMEALKAQAVAARSYAMAYTNNGSGSICSTENCQVFHTDPKGGKWEEAVNATAGQIMVQGGNPVKAWFSSTHGGYILRSDEVGWSSTSWTKHATDASGNVSSFSDLNSNAYDKESPWFYCDWGARGDEKTAWLHPSEVADIFNVIDLARRDSGTRDKLYQPDKPNPYGGEVWSPDRVKQELKARGGSPIDNVSDVSIGVDFGSGKVTSVSAGGISATGDEFKNWFNVRAPANIQIVGPLFNVEKR